MASQQHYMLAPSPRDAISSVSFSPSSPSHVLVSSWDRSLYLYSSPDSSSTELVHSIAHRAPILDATFGRSSSSESTSTSGSSGLQEEDVFTVGLDHDVRRVNLATGEQTVLSTHDAPSNKIVYSARHGLLISSGWDSTLHLHHPYAAADDPSSAVPPVATVPLPSKPVALALSPTKLIVAMTDRKINIYDVGALATLSRQLDGDGDPTQRGAVLPVEPWQRRDSPLKFLIRAVAAMPSDAGYACSSIEGRVAVEWFDESPEAQARNYAFKSHRVAAVEAATGEEVDEVHPVHALAFNAEHGSFVTGGGEGGVNSWDTFGKRRIRGYQRHEAGVVGIAFSGDWRRMAVAVSPGVEDEGDDDDGSEGGGSVDGAKVQVWLRELGEEELKPKKESRKK